MAEPRISKLTNEIIVFVPELDYTPDVLTALRTGTGQISADSVRDVKTPFGTHMVLATLTVTRVKAQTWDLREYVQRKLRLAGLDVPMDDILAPAKAKFYRV
jgi:hypothetical protein